MSEEYKILSWILSNKLCGVMTCDDCGKIFGEKYMCGGDYSKEKQLEVVKNIFARIQDGNDPMNVTAQDIADVLLL